MPRYWVIAPFESENRETFDKVWQFDVAENVISIGWQVGDVSKVTRDELSKVVASTYPDTRPATRALYGNMLWNFYHEIVPGDIVIARRGRKTLGAVGKVVQSATYASGKNPAADHPNFLRVEWQGQPRDKSFSSIVFPMQTLKEISEIQYQSLLEASGTALPVSDSADPESAEATDEGSFVLEKHLEEFIVSNFGTIFKGKLQIYKEETGVDGQQYSTDFGLIDILAVERGSGAFTVIELKRGRASDQVVGQILRYMGWVKTKLCKEGQEVKGLVICGGDPDPKLSYALKMTNDIEVRYYKVSFSLSEALPIS